MACRFFIIMPWGRVGSNLLMSLIQQARESKKLNSEMFNQLKTPEEQIRWFSEFYEIGREQSVTLIGSKQSLLSTRDISAIENLLRGCDAKLIRMRRDDCLRAAISQIRAEQYARETLIMSGKARWGVSKGEVPLGPSYIDPDVLVHRITMIEEHQKLMISSFSGLDILDLEYEEINTTLPKVYNRVADFLGFQARPYSVPFAKATPNDVRDVIVNIAEVKDAISGSPYAAYLS